MDAKLEIPPPVLELACKSRLLTIAELCSALGYSEEECVEFMDRLVEARLVRKTVTSKNPAQVYYWVPPKFGAKVKPDLILLVIALFASLVVAPPKVDASQRLATELAYQLRKLEAAKEAAPKALPILHG